MGDPGFVVKGDRDWMDAISGSFLQLAHNQFL